MEMRSDSAKLEGSNDRSLETLRCANTFWSSHIGSIDAFACRDSIFGSVASFGVVLLAMMISGFGVLGWGIRLWGLRHEGVDVVGYGGDEPRILTPAWGKRREHGRGDGRGV